MCPLPESAYAYKRISDLQTFAVKVKCTVSYNKHDNDVGLINSMAT